MLGGLKGLLSESKQGLYDPEKATITKTTTEETSLIELQSRIKGEEFQLKVKAQNELEENQHRRQQEKAKANLKRNMIYVSTFILTVVVAISLFACWTVLKDDKASDDNKKAALAAFCSVLTSTVAGIGGYIAGGKN